MLVWREQMSVGNDAIDEDHRYLIGVVNDIQAACHAREAPNRIMPLLGRLTQYTRIHFDREERMQRKIAYPGVQEHHELHEALKLRLVEIIKLLAETASQPQVDDATLERVLALNREWLVDHILKEDLKLKPYFKRLSPAFVG